MDEQVTDSAAGRGEDAIRSLATRRSRPERLILVAIGTVFLGIAAVGIVIPVLPTTPFVLLAAACYLRASTTLHARLIRSRTFGPTITAWEEHGAIPPRAKAIAIVMVIATFAVSIVFVVGHLALQIVLAALGATLVAWLAQRPSGRPTAGTDGARPQ